MEMEREAPQAGQSDAGSAEEAASLAEMEEERLPGFLGRLGLRRMQIWGLFIVVLAVQAPFIHRALRGQAEIATYVPFSDEFERETIGPNYDAKGGHWHIEKGIVHSPGVKNNPLWLKASLPANVEVEFDARSESIDGDIKVEIFGNGRDHASGYILVFGGWSNTISIIARLDEHGRDRIENRERKVEKGRTYRFRIERVGTVLKWFVDGELLLAFDDPQPLYGKGHDRFGFSSWDSDIYFDNLSLRAL